MMEEGNHRITHCPDFDLRTSERCLQIAKIADLIDLAIDRLAEFHAALTPEQKRILVDYGKAHEEECPPGLLFDSMGLFGHCFSKARRMGCLEIKT